MLSQKVITKAYTLFPPHIAFIAQVARNLGQSSDSAALRFIIEEYAQIKGLPVNAQPNNSQPTPSSSNPAD